MPKESLAPILTGPDETLRAKRLIEAIYAFDGFEMTEDEAIAVLAERATGGWRGDWAPSLPGLRAAAERGSV